MSYILDALKKAERERGIAKVPTLSSVHETHEAPRHHLRTLSLTALVFLAVGLGVSLFFSTTGKDARGTNPAGLEEQKMETARTVQGAFNDTERIRTQELASQGPETGSRMKVPEAPAAMPETGWTGQEASPALSGTDEESPSGLAEREIQGTGRPPGGPLQQDLAVNRARPSTDNARPVPAISSDDTSLPDALSESRTAPSQVTELQKAVGEMSISILSYAQNPADRLVFINGRKYVEGDFVKGIYLIESINRDGAVLSYKGEKATLRATSY